MMSNQELVGIHNDSAHIELVEIYNRRTKVGKANKVKCYIKGVHSMVKYISRYVHIFMFLH